MNVQALADIASDAMPRTGVMITRMSVFLSYQNEDHLRGLREDHEYAFALMIAHSGGMVRAGGITIEGWDMLESLFETLHDMYDHFASFRLAVENAG